MPSPPSSSTSSSSALFAALGLDPAGPLDDGTLRRAFTAAARRTHPDKHGSGGGGDSGAFAAARAAFEALADPASRARHASAARTAGYSAGGRAAPADVDLDDFTFEAEGGGGDTGGEADGEGAGRAAGQPSSSADPPTTTPPDGGGPTYWLACRCGGRYAVPEADLADAAAAASGGGGGGGGVPSSSATILVPCDGCSLVVRAHFCAAG